MTDNIVPGKIALLQGPPFASELARLSPSIFPRLRFGDLFMTTKLEAGIETGSSYVQAATNGVLPVKSRKASSPPMPAAAVPRKAAMVPRPNRGACISVLANVQKCTFLLKR